jgi:C1A family cysteine protease
MVYWGANTKYLLKDLEKIIDFKEILSENKTFKNTFTKVKEFIGNNQPVVAGALDMYYLHYYPEIYHKKHIPIHYILVVGYDDDKQEVYVQDCGCEGV